MHRSTGGGLVHVIQDFASENFSECRRPLKREFFSKGQSSSNHHFSFFREKPIVMGFTRSTHRCYGGTKTPKTCVFVNS